MSDDALSAKLDRIIWLLEQLVDSATLGSPGGGIDLSCAPAYIRARTRKVESLSESDQLSNLRPRQQTGHTDAGQFAAAADVQDFSKPEKDQERRGGELSENAQSGRAGAYPDRTRRAGSVDSNSRLGHNPVNTLEHAQRAVSQAMTGQTVTPKKNPEKPWLETDDGRHEHRPSGYEKSLGNASLDEMAQLFAKFDPAITTGWCRKLLRHAWWTVGPVPDDILLTAIRSIHQRVEKQQPASVTGYLRTVFPQLLSDMAPVDT